MIDEDRSKPGEVTIGGARTSPRAERVFFLGMALAISATVVVGFGRSFFLRPIYESAPAYAAPEPIFYFHGAVFTLWLALIVVQAWLIGAGRFRVHMRLGVAGAALAAVMVVLGVVASLIAANRPGGFLEVPLTPDQFLLIALTDVALFGMFAALGIANRRRPQAHKRLMILASVALTNPAIARVMPGAALEVVPVSIELAVSLFIVALVVWDLTVRRKLHPVTLCGGTTFLVVLFGRGLVAETSAWMGIGQGLMRLGASFSGA